jgi:hypothetical protein
VDRPGWIARPPAGARYSWSSLVGAIAQLAERLVCNQEVRGSNPLGSTIVMSPDIGMTPNPRQGSGFCGFAGSAGRGSGWPAGGLVVAAGVGDQLAEGFAGGGVDDADVQVADEHQDAGPGVGSAGADVVEAAGVAEGELAVGVDAVSADAVAGAGGPAAGGGFGPGSVCGGGGLAAGQGAVRPLVVAAGGERAGESLERGEVGGLGVLGGQPFLQGLLEPFRLAPGLRVVSSSVLLPDAEPAQLVLQGVAAAAAGPRTPSRPRPGSG